MAVTVLFGNSRLAGQSWLCHWHDCLHTQSTVTATVFCLGSQHCDLHLGCLDPRQFWHDGQLLFAILYRQHRPTKANTLLSLFCSWLACGSLGNNFGLGCFFCFCNRFSWSFYNRLSCCFYHWYWCFRYWLCNSCWCSTGWKRPWYVDGFFFFGKQFFNQ
jgi:hypothetical protein